jgi:hypothetical protein
MSYLVLSVVGPCFKDNKVIGIAFQGLDDADGISYIIPMTIVHHFLTEFEEKGTFGGFCSLGILQRKSKLISEAFMCNSWKTNSFEGPTRCPKEPPGFLYAT